MALWDSISNFIKSYDEVVSNVPASFQTFINLFILALIIILYSVFIWKFHKFIATKNIFKFDLNKYNTSTHPVLTKIFASGLYLLEYIILIPFIIFFWYVVFTFFLIIFIDIPIPLGDILLISAITIVAIRMTSYIPNYGETLSKKIAEVISFTFLAVSILNPKIFTNFLERVSQRFSEMPLFFSGVIEYLVFIIFLEILLRFFEFFLSIIGGEGEIVKETESG